MKRNFVESHRARTKSSLSKTFQALREDQWQDSCEDLKRCSNCSQSHTPRALYKKSKIRNSCIAAAMEEVTVFELVEEEKFEAEVYIETKKLFIQPPIEVLPLKKMEAIFTILTIRDRMGGKNPGIPIVGFF